jgi:Family of unknown function (DUF6519)
MKGDFTRFTFRPQNHYSQVLLQQGRGTLDADHNEQTDIVRHRIETEAVDVIGACGAPVHDPGFAITANGNSLLIGAGRYYVDGVLVENEEQVDVGEQPHLPPLAGEPEFAPGVYLAHLVVSDRHLTFIEKPAIRETALGGPDTATRVQTIWQVKLLPVRDEATTCASEPEEWTQLLQPSPARLRFYTPEPEPEADPCVIPPSNGFRGFENQLFRLEILNSGVLATAPDTPNAATYVYSHDNGSIVARWLNKSGNEITVSSTGRDDVLGFAAGNWIELTDDTRELNGLPGLLVQVTKVEGAVLTIDPGAETVDFDDFQPNPRVRRWDGHGTVAAIPTPDAPDGAHELEGNVRALFSGGPFTTGDWWACAARTGTGQIEFGKEPEPPAGTRYHRCKLAVLRLEDGQWTVVEDCRTLFPPLTELPSGTPAADPGVHVVNITTADEKTSLHNDSFLSAGQLAEGVAIHCDADVESGTLEGKPTCLVSLDLPFPANKLDRELWGDAVVGTVPLTLSGTATASGSTIVWKPNSASQQWLTGRLVSVLKELHVTQLLVHLRLRGRFVYQLGEPLVNVDGEAFGLLGDAGRLNAVFKSGDGRRGGDLELWFRLRPA